MAALAVVFTVMGLMLFVRRDIGAPYVLLERYLPHRRPPRTLPMQSWSLQSLDDTQRSWRGWTRALVGRRAGHVTRCC